MISGSAIKFDKRSQIDIHVSGREITCYKYDFSCKLRVTTVEENYCVQFLFFLRIEF